MAATLAVPPARAETSATFDLAARIVAGCEINGDTAASGQAIGQTGTLDFGTHSALETGPVTAVMAWNSAVSMRCTPSVALTMAIGAGLHADSARNLQRQAGTSRIAYRLYRDAGFSQELIADQPVPISFSESLPITPAIYGRLVLPGDRPAGTYSDTVVVTFAW
ncbi:Csu type fimbrial protein [Novosphingobium album (ex Liu et al. 2023)]|nr:spore coat U domain-containing protein [Novosphingobium album (ex Liu et al. 2023)]